MKRFGLIGHPIAHSLSPALFKAGYDGKYPYELIETDCFEEAYGRFLKDYDGINVTAPFKELAVAKADILSEECRLTGATNLLIKTPEGVKAFNSDFLGVRMWLQEEVCRSSVLIAGTGGAGKAAAAAALTLGMNVTLMNRSRDKAERLAEDFRKNGYRTDVEDLGSFRECFRKADIIIYNIPAAIPELEELSSNDFCPGRRKLILEANYRNPSFDEALVARIKEAGPETAYTGGRTWLLYQALTGYEIFTGEKPDLASMSAVL